MLKFKKEIKIQGRKEIEKGSNSIKELNYSLRGYGEFQNTISDIQDEFDTEVMKAVNDLYHILVEKFGSSISRPSMPSLRTRLKPSKFNYVFDCNFGKFEDIGKGILKITENVAELEISVEIV